MALPKFDIKDLVEAGVHFGHQTRRWNPKMAKYIFGQKNKVHILDLRQTVPMLNNALKLLEDVASKNGKILFVGTKRQAADIVKEAAERTGQYYVNHRWLGGMMTNWNTISESIRRLKQIERTIENQDNVKLTKKEILNLTRQQEKLNASLGGILEMGGAPDAIVVIDVNKEKLAIAEAHCLHIPVIAVCDTNVDPNIVDYPIPGNDDAVRSISLYCDLASKAILSGLAKHVSSVEQKFEAEPAAKKEEVKVEEAAK